MGLGQDLLDYNDLRRKEVEVPQWETTLTVTELGLRESMLSFGSLEIDSDGHVELTYDEIAQTVAFGVIDPETGERVFTDDEIPALARKNTQALKLLYKAIADLSGSVEDEVKN